MARGYLPVDRDQAFLLPPDLREWLPADHLAWFVLDVVGELDLGEFHARRRLGGAGRSGIIRWINEGSASPIAGAYPDEDTYIVDPPSWFTAVPASYSVDARLPLTNFFLAGMWQNSESTTAPGSPFVAHGTNIASTARLVSFAMNPLYRADPEREWSMVGSAAYWVRH